MNTCRSAAGAAMLNGYIYVVGELIVVCLVEVHVALVSLHYNSRFILSVNFWETITKCVEFRWGECTLISYLHMYIHFKGGCKSTYMYIC